MKILWAEKSLNNDIRKWRKKIYLMAARASRKADFKANLEAVSSSEVNIYINLVDDWTKTKLTKEDAPLKYPDISYGYTTTECRTASQYCLNKTQRIDLFLNYENANKASGNNKKLDLDKFILNIFSHELNHAKNYLTIEGRKNMALREYESFTEPFAVRNQYYQVEELESLKHGWEVYEFLGTKEGSKKATKEEMRYIINLFLNHPLEDEKF